MMELSKVVRTKSALSMVFHPQKDGQTERTNQEIEQYLQLYINHQQDDWMEWIACAKFTYNNQQHSATKFSPFKLEYGYSPRVLAKPTSLIANPGSAEFLQQLEGKGERARTVLEGVAAKMKEYADMLQKEAVEFKEGDRVWLDAENLQMEGPLKKLDVKQMGPFEVLEKVGPCAYRLKLPASWRVHPMFHIS
jgi:hypothetical protein